LNAAVHLFVGLHIYTTINGTKLLLCGESAVIAFCRRTLTRFLSFGAFLDGQLAAIVTALRANMVAQYLSTAVAACAGLDGGEAVVGSSLCCSSL